MLDYTAGFLVNDAKTHIVLVHKNRGPKSIIGKWTGVGGKIEISETAVEAQEREFVEETGVIIPQSDWTHFASFYHSVYDLNFFLAFEPMAYLSRCTTMEDEEIKVIPLNELHKYDIAYGTGFLIPLLLSDFVHWPIHFRINGNRED